MKKIISGILALTLCASMLCACEEVESSSVQTPMTTTTLSPLGEAGTESNQTDESSVEEQTEGTQPSTQSESEEVTQTQSYLQLTMKDWDEMNTDSKYVNMESILKYITDSGVNTSLDVVDLVTALDRSGNTSKNKTVYETVMKKIKKSKKQ